METKGIAWAHSEAGQQLQKRLNSEKTIKSLDHLLERMDTLEAAIDRLGTILDQGPGMLSMATDMVDEAYQRSAEKGVNLEMRLSNALHAAEQLTAPATIDKLDQLLAFSDQLPGLMAMMMDTVDEEVMKARDKGLDFQPLKETGIKAATALAKAAEMPPARIGGIFGLMRELKDPDRQKALGFLMNFAKAFGKEM
ncbi:MAG: DUF1641 domain-containing protein [Saprospiraceae bacterium]